jgi:DNA-binding response OmpR family regulator
MSGQEVCREVQRVAPELPIIILSASSAVADKILLLEMGAHDYVTKPFSPRELLARVRAALRQSTLHVSGDVFGFGDVTVSFSKVEVKRQGEVIALSAQEFRTLAFMIENAGRVISRKELLVKVWGYQKELVTRTVDIHMVKLRQKLEKDPVHPAHFRTVRSVGYKFTP